MEESPPTRMFCPYCQQAVVRLAKPGDDEIHRWCFIHLSTNNIIKGNTTPDVIESFYALCAAHTPPKAKVRRVRLTHAQRTSMVPGRL